MAVFLSPGVFVREVDLSATAPQGIGSLTPAFIGTADKGPVNEPIFVTNAQQAIDAFGEPFPESFLMYGVLAYFEEGARAKHSGSNEGRVANYGTLVGELID